MSRKYAVGIDFGTESGRAAVFDLADGSMVASSVFPYVNGVITDHLPSSDEPLPDNFALQDPNDYLSTIRVAGRQAIAASGASAEEVVGIGIDFTSCTMMPTTAEGVPMSSIPQWRDDPHAWVKLWKHHAAQPYADRINALARVMDPTLLEPYGGKISSEWFFPKLLQILEEAPLLFDAAHRFIEASDWVVWQLTGVETRSRSTAGYKAMWSADRGYPPAEFLTALNPRLRVAIERMPQPAGRLGQAAGGLTEEAAGWLGLQQGVPVAIANLDAHASVPACGVTEPGRMVMIMGTSICHLVSFDEPRTIEGICGVVSDGIIPGTWGFEAGQSCVGDHFAWFARNAVPGRYTTEARARGITELELLEELAGGLRPGASGLLALDWWNGNRSVLVDTDLTGVLVGATLATRPEEIFRALIEATAFGTRTIIEAFEEGGVPILELVACGGLPQQNRLLMQIFADVTDRTISVAASAQAPALGAAMHAAVAAGTRGGGFASIQDAAAAMGHLGPDRYTPDGSRRRVYDELFIEYQRLHDYFGRGGNDVLKRLKRLRQLVASEATISSATHA